MNCRICNFEMDVFGVYQKSALEVSRLYSNPKASQGVEIKLYSCPACGHYQIPYINSNDYYDEYVMTASHSQKMQQLQSKQSAKLSSLALKRDFFLEIGCGDGSFLMHAKGLFNSVLGVEPSKPFYELCRDKNLNVINDYLTEKLTFDVKFDAFASRQVFEHIEHPKQVFSIIHRLLNDTAVGLIEVPNAQKMISDNRYFDLFSDHINYYTPLSLCNLAKLAGFDVVSVEESFNGDYLELYVRKQNNGTSMREKRDADLGYLNEYVSKYENVSAWGAGAKAQAIMTALGDELPLRYLFDTDVHKSGKYIVNCGAKISPPNTDSVNANSLIIIFAVSYQDEIINSLKNDYKYTGDILCLDGTLPRIVI
jgi:cyclopropane fatty-acyl-phospholipid synthase-like methyltransferase